MLTKLRPTLIGFFFFFLIFFFSLVFDQGLITSDFSTYGLFALFFLMLLAGILDGFNPCAFSTLLLWSGFLINRFGSALDDNPDIHEKRKSILGYAFYYAIGIFFVYFLLGLGIIQLFNLTSKSFTLFAAQIAGFFVVVLGLIMLRDATHPKAIIKMPAFLHPLYKKYREPTTKLAAFLSGAVIGLCTIPCGGAIYMAVLLILKSQALIVKYPLLFVYNIGFILPVVLLAFTLTNKKLLQGLSQDFIRFRNKIKIIIGVITILMGLLAIYLA